MDDFTLEKHFYTIAKQTVDSKIEEGIHAHTKHIKLKSGMKEYVKMFDWTVFDTVMELKSEPFETMEEAKHFSTVFNDCFLYDSYCTEENDKYYVYSGWVLPLGFLPYVLSTNGKYYLFANWS